RAPAFSCVSSRALSFTCAIAPLVDCPFVGLQSQGVGLSGMTSRRMLIRGGQVYDHDGDVHKPALADILIEGDRIVSVGPTLAPAGHHDVIDACGRLIVPGLINAHYHSHDVLCRGLFEELPLEIWLLYTLPMGGDRSEEEVRARTLVGALECLRCGITT